MRIDSKWVKYQQPIHLLNAKSAIHHLVPGKDLRSMKNMLRIEGKVVAGNNIYHIYIRLTSNDFKEFNSLPVNCYNWMMVKFLSNFCDLIYKLNSVHKS